MSKTDGFNFKQEDKKKIWRVARYISESRLEDELNELADGGYHAFRIDKDDSTGNYMIVAFDAIEMGKRSAMASTAALQAMANLPKV